MRGLENLEDSPLKTQLAALLQSHIKELVPQVIEKARVKNMLKNHTRKIRDRTTDLKNYFTSTDQDLPANFTKLEKTNRDMGVPAYNDGELYVKKREHLEGMLRAMQKETKNSQEDDVRLFISLLIILLAQEHKGVIWATGKLSPKLLKLLKQLNANLDPVLGQQLDQWKEAISSKTVTDEMRGKMKWEAAECLGKSYQDPGTQRA
jgi:hypothetical protein